MLPALLILGQTPLAPPVPSRVKSIVLVFHDFVPTRGKGSVWFDCTPAEFKTQLDALQRLGVRFIPLETLVGALKGSGKLPPRAVCLTFADGYAGFARFASPELARRGIPAAMFSHTGFIGSNVGRPKLTWAQMGSLERQGVRFYSQTISHPTDLRALSDGALRKEFVDSRHTLETRLGGTRDLLAYPNGKWNTRVARFAKEAGYIAAFTEDQRPAQTAESLWSIPRYVHTRWRKAVHDAWGVTPR
ncbi:hypothetical protein BH11ARM2_BH11ARM2_12160 [soil metagenome]